MRKHLKCIYLIIMLTNLAFVFICVRASSALVRTSAFLQPIVRGQVYIFEISPPLHIAKFVTDYKGIKIQT